MHPPSDSAEWTVQMGERTVHMMARAEALAEALVGALTRAKTLARAQAQVLAWAQAVARVRAEVRAQTLAQTRARALALGVMEALAVARARSRALAHTVTYGEVLADSELKDIIYSIKSDHRYRLVRDLWHHSEHWWFIQMIAPITRLPRELLHQILLIIVDNAGNSPLVLMQVSKHWYTIVTSIWASLKLGTTTSKDAVMRKLEMNQSFLDVVVDTEIDCGRLTLSEDAYQAIFVAIEAAPRWRSLVVEAFPAQVDLPDHLVNSGLQRCSDAVLRRLRTLRVKCPCETSPLLDHLLHVLGTSASEELTTVELNSANVVSFLVPAYSSIFRSVTVLSLDAAGLPSPVDLLPHLHQLQSLTASHLPLPVYHNDVDLPFVRTLHHLRLRSVSIQWMSGRIFQVLETCTFIFPIHHHVLDTFCATLPNCKDLTFEGYPLDILNGVSANRLTHLSVVCSSSYTPRGNRQLARLCSQALRESRLAPRILHVSIEATDEAWIKALTFMSNLEELVIHNAQPSSLGVKVLQSLVVHAVHVNDPSTTDTPGTWSTPVCPSLKRFGLRYRRWLRPSEHFDLIPVFVSIIQSREQSNFSLYSFRIWSRIDQNDPLELIEGLSISLKGFEVLRYYTKLADNGSLNLPMRYDDLAALSSVVRSEVLNGELLRRVRGTKGVELDEIDDIVRSMMELPLDQIACSLQDQNTFLSQIENARQARQPRPLNASVLDALDGSTALPPTTSRAASTGSTLLDRYDDPAFTPSGPWPIPIPIPIMIAIPIPIVIPIHSPF